MLTAAARVPASNAEIPNAKLSMNLAAGMDARTPTAAPYATGPRLPSNVSTKRRAPTPGAMRIPISVVRRIHRPPTACLGNRNSQRLGRWTSSVERCAEGDEPASHNQAYPKDQGESRRQLRLGTD